MGVTDEPRGLHASNPGRLISGEKLVAFLIWRLLLPLCVDRLPKDGSVEVHAKVFDLPPELEEKIKRQLIKNRRIRLYCR